MLIEKVKKTIQKYNLIESGDTVIIGVSGGPDSICMLHVLHEIKEKLNFKICVAHINHSLRTVADDETKYVEEFCFKLGVQCFVKKIDVLEMAKEQKMGIEETGRMARYEFFDEVIKIVEVADYSGLGACGQASLQNNVKIATAHNNNDKIETIVMNILRGSGASGLKGIEPSRANKYIRPLIEVDREEVEKYCNENNLNPKYDESNDENEYTRNKIRNIVLPYIKQEFNPNIVKTLSRLSEVVVQEGEYLNKITKEAYNSIVLQVDVGAKNQIVLDLKKFNSLELVIKRRAILYTINELLGTTVGIEKINIDDIIKLCNNNIGNKYLTPIKNMKVLVKKGGIFFAVNTKLP